MDPAAAFRATFHSHIMELRNRDISHVLHILQHHSPRALAADEGDLEVHEDKITPPAWAALWAYATSDKTARPCARCGQVLPHLWAALRHGAACAAPPPLCCDYPCRFVTIDKAAMEAHRAACPHATEPCAWCRRSFPRQCRHAERCAARPTPCPGCGAAVPLCEMKAHAATCRAVHVSCPHDGCTARVPREELEAHCFRCPRRSVKCPWCQRAMLGEEADEHIPNCARRKVQCTQCGVAVEWGPGGRGLKRHHFEKHRMPDAIRDMACALRCGEGAPCRPACAAAGARRRHAVRHRFRCGAEACTTCRPLQLMAAFHEKDGPCTRGDACRHPLCLRQLARCSWPGCSHEDALDMISEHERMCPHRPVHCPICEQGPLDMESMRAHLQPPHGCARVAAARALDPAAAEAERRHARHCAEGGAARCSRCRVWARAERRPRHGPGPHHCARCRSASL